jgi:hypothetical protein
LRILDRDLKAASIAKTDERGRTLDVHALRTTFGTLLSKGGVAPRTAQAAMRHSDIRLTMQTYTDPKLLDVRGALDSLPSLPLGPAEACTEELKANGSEGENTTRRFTPAFTPTAGQAGQTGSIPVPLANEDQPCNLEAPIGAMSSVDKGKEPVTLAVTGSLEWSLRDSNPRLHGCDPCALTS